MVKCSAHNLAKILPLITLLYFSATLTICDGNRWAQVPSLADGPQAEDPSSGRKFFQPFDGADWTLFGLTALADFADMDSSYSLVENGLHAYNTSPSYGTVISCPPGWASGSICYEGHRTIPAGEGNPLITGIFGTRYPTALDYAAFGVLELGIQTVIAWALPERWRTGAWGLFIGIGTADTVMNSYGGGVTFRF